ncbi:hypothetical protein [Massilia sp.]|uniref:hypothetical protein n=1 Tax=Massilia sp. TaxID=1882437 RepID=UPI00289BE09F|nr:hypothetical protein [Massilia sp.]
MLKLIQELMRLYLPEGAVTEEALQAHILGQQTLPVDVTTSGGLTRAIAIPFHRIPKAEEGRHWTLLCEVAHALQSELDLPAPAVSIASVDGFCLWLSLAVPLPSLQAGQFVELLRQAYFPEIEPVIGTPAELPPCLNRETGRWTAFINPGMGASFVGEPGLEIAPPQAAQAGFLEGLESITPVAFDRAMDRLLAPAMAADETVQPTADAPATVAAASAVPENLLLKDATLEDIVRHLHALNIEPTFRHLLPPARA